MKKLLLVFFMMVINTCFLYAGIEGIQELRDKAFKSNNIDEKIENYQKILSIMNTPNEDGINDWTETWEQGEAVISLIKLYIQKDPKISLKDLLEKTNYREYSELSQEIDLNNDNKKEIFINIRDFCIGLTDSKGKVNYIEYGVGGLGIVEIVKIYTTKNNNNKLILFRFSGKNAYLTLIGLDGGIFKKIFTSASSSYSGINFKDMDNDKEDEILCNETLEYKWLYWPIIYKWNGNGFDDISLRYPDYLINEYRAISYPEKRAAIMGILKNRSTEYAHFVEKYLAPIKEGFKPIPATEIDPNY